MKYKNVMAYTLAAALAVAPLSSAEAHDWHHGGFYHHNGGVLAAGVGILAITAAILTAPINAVAEASQPAYYAPQQPQPQNYYAPQQAYYAPPQAYYAPPPQAYYAPAPAYYAPYGYYR